MPQLRPLDHPAESSSQPLYTKRAGTAPLPGYVLLEPLGRGGFGEVWKCEVPGGLHKAIKFVAGGSTRDETLLRQEYEAFQQVKAIRHPFLLCLERVELVGDELVMVMGLADRHIGERFHECAAAGLPGIPRAELLGYLREAAEALDVIGSQYGLQHLDVKPANLFLTAGHVQVGDYGLVSKLDQGAGGKNRGLTPKYAAPEVLRGEVHTRSDQYSLALVYQELLTGTFPFSGRTAPQLMLQHMTAAPNLSGLPESDRGAIAVALAKDPNERFPSCRELIDTLLGVVPSSSRMGGSSSGTVKAPGAGLTVTPSPVSSPTQGPADSDVPTQGNGTATPTPRLPRLVGIKRPAPQSVVATPPPVPATPPPAAPQSADPAKPAGVRLPFVISVVPVEWLRGREAPDPDLTAPDMVRALLVGAGASWSPDLKQGVVEKSPDGTFSCRFLTTYDPRIAKVKLDLLWELGGVTMDVRHPQRVVFQRAAVAAPPRVSGKVSGKAPPPPSGLEVVVDLPGVCGVAGEVVATGHLFGDPPPEFVTRAEKTITDLLTGIRMQLNNTQERRKHPRIPAEFSVKIFPIRSDGRVESPLSGQTVEVSAGGASVRTTATLNSSHVYLAFDGVRGTTGLAVLAAIVRLPTPENGFVFGCRYRLDVAARPQ